MGLRMNNFNILGFTEKSDFYENQYRGGIAQKGGLRQFAGLKGGGLGKKDGGCFWGEFDTLVHTMVNASTPNVSGQIYFELNLIVFWFLSVANLSIAAMLTVWWSVHQ